MFTGLIEDLGRLESRSDSADGAVLRVKTGRWDQIADGDSVAVNGVCLTATAVFAGGFDAEAMNQTLSLTTLGDLAAGDPVNIELAAQIGDRLGGHIVQGHVDGVGTVAAVTADGFSRRLRVKLPTGLAGYVVERGSVTLDGVSLTVSAASEPAAGDEPWLEVSLIPETQERTTLGRLEPNRRLNIECDVIAKYVERQSGGQQR